MGTAQRAAEPVAPPQDSDDLEVSADQEASEQTSAVKRLDQLFAESNIAVPDEFVGPESSAYVLAFGKAELLADSRRPQDRTAHERRLADELIGLAKAP
jgi:hypothetical protein